MFQRETMFSATKPKSAIDDLFADADSEEDSDDIFSSKNVVKKRAMQSSAGDNAYQTKNAEDMPKKFLDVIIPGSAGGNIATSTPETHGNVMNLFSDEENDDSDLFGAPKKQPQKSATNTSAATTQDSSKKVNCCNYIYVCSYIQILRNNSKVETQT